MISLKTVANSIGNYNFDLEVDLNGMSSHFVIELLREKARGQETVHITTLLNRCKHLSLNHLELYRLHHILVKSHLWSEIEYYQSLLKFYILHKPDEAKTIFIEALHCIEESHNDFLSPFLLTHLKKARKGNADSGRIVNFFILFPIVLGKSYRSIDIMNSLLQAGASINNSVYMGTAFLRWSLDAGHTTAFVDLLKKGANISCLFNPKPLPALVKFLQDHFQIATPLTATTCIDKLLEMNIPINFSETVAGSLLEKALLAEDVDLARRLLQKGTNPNGRDSSGKTPFLLVCNMPGIAPAKQIELITLLEEHHADLNATTLNDELHGLHILCGNEGNLLTIEFLLKKNFPVDVLDKLGLTPLDYAFKTENIPVVLKLVEYGSNGLQKYSNDDLLILAEDQKNTALLQKMLERGFNINSLGPEGKTLLLRTIDHGYSDWVAFLVANGADVNVTSKRGTTPLMVAIDYDLEITRCLIENGAKLFNMRSSGKCAIDDLLRRDLPSIIHYIAHRFLEMDLLQKFTRFSMTETGLHEFAEAVSDALGTPEAPSDLFPYLCFSVLFNYNKLSAKIFKQIPSDQLRVIIQKLYTRFPELTDNLPYMMLHVMNFQKGHLVMTQTDIMVLPCPENIHLDCLLTMFGEINFTDSSNKLTYIDPSRIFNDYQSAMAPKALEECLKKLLHHIKYRLPYLGTPKPDTPELITFYERLELFLKHICYQLQKMENNEERSRHVIDIALAADNCGARWLGDSYDKYKFLCHHSNPFPTFQDRVYNELTKLRSGLVRFISGDDVHEYARTIRLLGVPLAIPGALGMADLTDPLRPNHEGTPYRYLYADFLKVYHPHRIYQVVELLLNEILKTDIEIFHKWMRENIPAEWRQETFNELHSALSNARPFLFQYNQILKKYGIPPLKNIKELDRHIQEYKEATFMDEDFYDFANKCLTQTTIRAVLKKLHILSECRWGILDLLAQR